MTRSKWVGGEGDWADAADWSHGVPDGADATAAIKERDRGTVNIAQGESFTVGRVHVENSNTLNVVGQLNFHELVIDHDAFVDFTGSRTFDNGLIQFAGGPRNILSLFAGTHSSGSPIMTLGSNETLKSTSGGGDIECVVVNQGLITAAGAAGLSFFRELKNDKMITVSAGAIVKLYEELAGSGQATVSTGATLEVEQVTSRQTIHFLDGNGALILDDPAAFSGVVKGFQAGDTIDLLFTQATSVGLNNQDLLTVSNGSQVIAQIQLTGTYSQSDFNLSSDGNGGTLITTSHPPAAVARLAQAIAARPPPAAAHDAGLSLRAVAGADHALALPRP